MGNRMSNIATPMPPIRARFTSKLGIPLSGCKVYTYEPNSNIPKTTWIDIDKTVENTNPILLDAAGEADIFLDGLYQIIVKDRFGFVVYDVEKTGSTQQQINDFTGNYWYAKPLGYELNARVMLTNGDIVKNTTPNNTVNPNVDMTGWKFDNDIIKSIADLMGINSPKDGQVLRTKGFHKATNLALAQPYAGGSAYVYSSTISKNKHNGGTVIASGKSLPTDWTVRSNVESWFDAPTDGFGCWVLVYGGQIDVTWFGAIPTFSIGIDNSIAINKALSIKNNIHIPTGNYIVHRPILTHTAHPVITGDGISNTLITVENSLWSPATFKSKTYNAAIVITSGIDMSWIEGATLQGFSLLGNSYSDDGKIGIYFDNVCMKVNVENVAISAFNKGIYTLKSWVHSYNNVSITDCITNSMHLDTYVNGYSFTGCLLYGKSVTTSKHLVIENASYGNSWTGGAIEKCNVAISLKDSAQLNVSGIDIEIVNVLFVENVNNAEVPSTIQNSSIMGNPSQSGFACNNGNLILSNNKIFNPLGSQNIDAPVYFVGGTGGVVANNNEYGSHTTLIEGDGKVTGSDVGRFDFSKSRRITAGKILDAYSETYQATFSFKTNSLVDYPSVSGFVLKTQIGNTYKARIGALLAKVPTLVGDYFTFQFSELSNVQGVVGTFAFSPSNNLLGTDCITGQVICNSGTCYLMKSSGGLLTKAALNTTTDSNLFSLSLSYTDTI